MLEFSRSYDEFTSIGAEVVAISTDDLEKASETGRKHKIRFPLGYGLVATEVAAKTGGFYNEKDGRLHANGFIIRPDGTIDTALYSTSGTGRLLASDCIKWIRAYSKQ